MFHHISVMLNETIDYLNVKENGVYIDCTLGGAGHALYLLNQLNDDGRLIAIDQDQTAIDFSPFFLISSLIHISEPTRQP